MHVIYTANHHHRSWWRSGGRGRGKVGRWEWGGGWRRRETLGGTACCLFRESSHVSKFESYITLDLYKNVVIISTIKLTSTYIESHLLSWLPCTMWWFHAEWIRPNPSWMTYRGSGPGHPWNYLESMLMSVNDRTIWYGLPAKFDFILMIRTRWQEKTSTSHLL